MPARVLPPTSELERLVRQGYTHAQIAARVSREAGRPVSRSSVSAALHRANKTAPAKRYPQEIPWQVKEGHQGHYAARMLRILGRRRARIRNSAENDARLDAWLSQLQNAGAVVTYYPDTEDGFFYRVGLEPDHTGVPVRAVAPL